MKLLERYEAVLGRLVPELKVQYGEALITCAVFGSGGRGGAGPAAPLSPILKTPEEAAAGSPLFLDMVEDAKILYDEGGFFAAVLARLRARLRQLGPARTRRGRA